MAPERVTPFQGSLEAYHKAFGAFINRCSGIDPAQAEQLGVCGVWSARQVVEYLSGWNHEAARALNEWLADGSPMPDYDIDAFNAASVAVRAEWGWEDVLADLRAGHLAMQQAVVTLVRQNSPDYAMFTTWLGILAQEFEAHGAQLASASQP